MTYAINRETTSITISTFWENNLLKKYNFDPEYQRLSVWSDDKQSFLIDSILRNYPIPPIFLHQHIDASNGKTTYDVIDGKQRLTSILRFINNEIPVSSDTSEDDADVQAELIAGKYFREFDATTLQNFKKSFWRYAIPIEYIDTTDKNLIKGIFDRLNRNGEPLEGQELRKAEYSGTPFIALLDRCCELPFWKPILSTLDTKRMEDKEFISELLFLTLLKAPNDGSQKSLDELYNTYAKTTDIASLENSFHALTDVMAKVMEPIFKIGKRLGTSHIYGVFSFIVDAHVRNENLDKWEVRLVDFYQKFASNELAAHPTLEAYRVSVTYRTRTRGQRARRLQALKEYVYSN